MPPMEYQSRPDIIRALPLLRQAAAQGVADAQSTLAFLASAGLLPARTTIHSASSDWNGPTTSTWDDGGVGAQEVGEVDNRGEGGLPVRRRGLLGQPDEAAATALHHFAMLGGSRASQ
eukprot:scaffold294282_cov43-Prasinocladus_malaysianus.AAC.1